MKKSIMLIALTVVGMTVVAMAQEIIRVAPLSTATTNTVTFTARDGRVTEPVLFVTKVTGITPNSATITIDPIESGAPTYTAVAAASVSNTTSTVVLNDYSDSTSDKVVMLGGDILTITGTAGVWTNTDYYMVIKETVNR